jgi:hypothetical protein
MIKKLLVLLITLSVATATAQSVVIKGVVKDITSNQPLSHVTVSSDDGKWVTITNDEGAFSLACPASTKKIVFSCLGFAPYSSTTANPPDDGMYYLEPKDFELDEIVIINTTIDDFMNKLIKSSIQQLKAPVVLNTYYREFIKINNKNTKFADGLVDYNLYKKKPDNIKTGIVVKQSRAVELDTFTEGMVRGVGPSVVDAMLIQSNFLMFSQIFHKKSVYKKYDYTIKSLKSEDNQPLSSITFTPKPGVKDDLYNVTVLYNPDRNIILDIEFKAIPELAEYTRVVNILLARYTISLSHYKSSFKVVNGIYMPSYSFLYGVIHIWNKNYDNTYRLKCDMIVTNYSLNEADFTKKDQYDERTLYERGNNYTEEFWLKNNSIVLTDEEEQIIQSLNKQKQQIQTKTN